MIEHPFNLLLPSIEHFRLLGYWLAFFAALFETLLIAGLFIPGSTFLLLLGAVSANGDMDIGDLIWFAAVGALLGDNLNYFLGRRFGQRWLQSGIWFLKSTHIDKGLQFFERHGAKSVFLARFIPSFKEVAPFVAGTSGMSPKSFMFWNLLGAICWSLQWVGGGFLFGQSIALAQVWMSRAGLAFVAILMVWLMFWFIKRFVVQRGAVAWLVLRSIAHSVHLALLNNGCVVGFIDQHPRISRFVVTRLDRNRFEGLPASLMALSFFLCLVLLASIVQDFIATDPIIALDHATAELVRVFRFSQLVPMTVWITSLGAAKVVIFFVLVTCLVLWLNKKPWLIAGLLLSTIGSTLFTSVSKLIFQRPRPMEAIMSESSYSFPSGHATIAVAYYGFMGYLLIRSARQRSAQVRLLMMTLVIILLIGGSRLYLGVHYLSDVWAGFLVGTLWLIVGISVSEWLTVKGNIHWGRQREQRSKLVPLSLLVLSVVGFVGYAGSRAIPHEPAVVEQYESVNGSLIDLLQQQRLDHTTTVLGAAEQPLSFAIAIHDKTELIAQLQNAGWQPVDAVTPRSLLRLARQGLEYIAAPIPPAFWNDRINDLVFARTMVTDHGEAVSTLRLWNSFYRLDQRNIYVGVVREYEGMRWQFLRSVAPDVDKAADRFIETLVVNSPAIMRCQKSLTPPSVGQYQMGNPFFSRGELRMLDYQTHLQERSLCD